MYYTKFPIYLLLFLTGSLFRPFYHTGYTHRDGRAFGICASHNPSQDHIGSGTHTWKQDRSLRHREVFVGICRKSKLKNEVNRDEQRCLFLAIRIILSSYTVPRSLRKGHRARRGTPWDKCERCSSGTCHKCFHRRRLCRNGHAETFDHRDKC